MPKLSAYNTVTAPGTGDYIPLHNSGVSNSRIHPSSLFSSVLGYAGQSGKYFTTNGLSGTWVASTSLSIGGLSGYIQINNGLGGLTGHPSFIYSGGNVGIGVSQPLFPLHVSGTGYITRLDLVNLNILGEATGIFPFQGSSSGKILATNGTSTLWVPSGGAGANIPAGSNTQIQYNSGGAFAGSASFVFSGSGVGIGTFSPAANLDVRGRVYIDKSGVVDFGNTNDCFFSVGNYYSQGGIGYGELGIGIDNGGGVHIQSYNGGSIVFQDYGNKIGFFGHPNAAFFASFANNVGPSGNNTINFGSPSFKWLSGYFNHVDLVNLNVSGATTGIFPSQGSNSGKILATNGSSLLWANSGGGGGGTPGGSDKQIQYNFSGAFGGSNLFTYDYSVNPSQFSVSGSGSFNFIRAFSGISTPSSGLISIGTLANPFGSGYINYQQFVRLSGVGLADISGANLALTTPLGLLYGGTAATTASGAINTIVPSQAGNSGRVLATNGVVVSWVNSGAGGGGSPGGSTTHVQFNSGGTFSGHANFVYNHSSVVPILGLSGSGSFNFVNVYSGISTPTSGIPNIGSITNPFNSGYFRNIYADRVIVNSGFSGAAYTWPYYITWTFPSGILSGNATNASYEIPIMRPCVFQSGAFCSARSKTAPSGLVGASGGSGVIFDFNINSTGAVWTNKTRRLNIPNQAVYGSQTGFDYSGILNVGDYLSIDIVNYPTGQYANDIIVQIMLMSQHP
jgi:hypothetical protein